MKLSSTQVQEAPTMTSRQTVSFPGGIVGFADFTQAEILYQPEALPFMWLKSSGKDALSFIVVDPAGLVPNYDIEVSDADIEALGLRSVEEALVLNIATLHKDAQGSKITLNLIGPVIVNRRTLVGRQVIISNCQKYSARHLLLETKTASASSSKA